MHYSLRSLEVLKVIITLNSQFSTLNLKTLNLKTLNYKYMKKALLRIRARQGFLT